MGKCVLSLSYIQAHSADIPLWWPSTPLHLWHQGSTGGWTPDLRLPTPQCYHWTTWNISLCHNTNVVRIGLALVYLSLHFLSSPIPLSPSPLFSQGLEIQSDPALNAEGILQIELEKTVSLTCLSAGASGTWAEEELVWLRNGALVQLMEGNKKGRSSLCVTPVTREDNAATFTCQLKGDASVNSSVTLDVTCESH